MKKGTKNFKLDDGWWKKESHPEVFKAAEKFGRALKAFSAADNSLNLTADDEQLSQSELAELKKATTLLADVEKEGRDFAGKCQGLGKSSRDKKAAEAFAITGDVLKKALPKAIQDKREEYDSYDGDADDAPLVTPEAHKAYLKKMLPRLKRMPLNFGFALVSGEPTDQRFLFHKQKAPRSLSTSLKSDTNAKKLTFGTAAAGHLVAEERYGGNTLILSLEGKPVPNLARRARLLFQKLGIATFNKIVVTREGQEVELSDEDEAEVELPEVEADDDDDLDEDVSSQGAPVDEEQPAPPPPPAPEQAAPKPKPEPPQKSPEEQRWLEMRAALGGLLERAVTVGHPPAKKARAVWGMAKGAAEKGDYGGAIKAATMVQALLKGFDPPPENIAERYARQSRKIVPLLTAHVKDGRPGGRAMRQLLSRAETLAENGQHAAALELLDTLARDLARGGPDAEPVPRAPEDRSGFARTLLVKADLMSNAAEDLADVYEEPERRAFVQEVNQTLDTAREALGDPNDPAAERDFPAAFAAFQALERILARARKAGKRNSTTLTRLATRIRELDGEVMALAPRVDEPELVELFATAAQARQGVAQAMRRKDVFGAMARIGPWEEAVSALREAAGAPQPETV